MSNGDYTWCSGMSLSRLGEYLDFYTRYCENLKDVFERKMYGNERELYVSSGTGRGDSYFKLIMEIKQDIYSGLTFIDTKYVSICIKDYALGGREFFRCNADTLKECLILFANRIITAVQGIE